MQTELSNALAAWTFATADTSFEDGTRMLRLSMDPDRISPSKPDSRREGRKQAASRVITFCHCPQVGALLKSDLTERRIGWTGICVMSYLPDF